MISRRSLAAAFGLTFSCLLACSSDEDPPAGSGGAGGSGAAGGKAGTGGSGGSVAGTGTGGTAGKGGTGGAGAATGGTGGSAGTGGNTGGGGSGGAAAGMSGGTGKAGAGGTSAGASGSAGAAGSGGIAGGAGSAGSSAGTAGAAGSGGSSSGGTFTLTSPAFANAEGCSEDTPEPCEVFPNENLSYMSNMNISPELNWTGVPEGTQSFAVVLQDLSNGFAHWVLWNISGDLTMLAENIPKDSAMPSTPEGSQQCNLAQGDGYFGPGSACNVYEFVLYALSMETFSPTQATDAAQVRTQLQGLDDAILGTASLRGRSNYMMMCDD